MESRGCGKHFPGLHVREVGCAIFELPRIDPAPAKERIGSERDRRFQTVRRSRRQHDDLSRLVSMPRKGKDGRSSLSRRIITDLLRNEFGI